MKKNKKKNKSTIWGYTFHSTLSLDNVFEEERMQGGRRKQHFLVWTVFKRLEFRPTLPTLVFTQM